MACFLVPAAEAVVVTAVALTLKKKRKKSSRCPPMKLWALGTCPGAEIYLEPQAVLAVRSAVGRHFAAGL